MRLLVQFVIEFFTIHYRNFYKFVYKLNIDAAAPINSAALYEIFGTAARCYFPRIGDKIYADYRSKIFPYNFGDKISAFL